MEVISRAETGRYWGSWLLRKKFNQATFSKIIFDNVTFKYAKFNECVWHSCRFRDCHLGAHTEFRGCLWEDCSYIGKYSSMSGIEFFETEFKNVEIKSALVHGVRFSNCKFSGRLSNLIFIGKDDKHNWSTSFENCDLSEVELDNVSFVGGIDLSTMKLPKRGIRVFSNIGDEFTNAMLRASLQLEGNDAIPFKVYAETTKGQNLVVADIPTFEYLFRDTTNGRVAFDSLAKMFEISE
jgi:hypothetical protein